MNAARCQCFDQMAQVGLAGVAVAALPFKDAILAHPQDLGKLGLRQPSHRTQREQAAPDVIRSSPVATFLAHTMPASYRLSEKEWVPMSCLTAGPLILKAAKLSSSLGSSSRRSATRSHG